MIYVGTSGWVYDSWRKRFYPADLSQKGWLRYFSGRFPTVEINNSFYRLPTEEAFKRWREGTPDEFLFAVKASRFITHIKRLREGKDPNELFWSRARHLGSKLGPVLYQLPPGFRVDLERLRAFMKTLPKAFRPAFEFRDQSWTSDEVCSVLDEAGAAYVLADRPGARVPEIVTGGWSYIRFHKGGQVRPGYSRRKLERWADRIAGLEAGDVFVYFNNDTLGAAVRDARTLMDLLDARGVHVASVSKESATASSARTA